MNILISGCSYSHDSGFINPAGKVWHHHINHDHNVKNVALRGQSNYKIFTKACTEILADSLRYDLVIIQWTTLYRLTVNNGKSIYDNSVCLTLSDTQNKSKFRKLWVNNYIHPRVELLEFLTLVSTISVFLNSLNVNYVFIKGFDNYLTDLCHDHWSLCSDSFKDLVLNKDQLPDWEIDLFYEQLRTQYLSMVNLSKDHWVNFHHNDWFQNIIDVADDGIHAGTTTNKNFYCQINNFVKKFNFDL